MLIKPSLEPEAVDLFSLLSFSSQLGFRGTAEMPPVAELQMLPWGTSIQGNQAPEGLSLRKAQNPARLNRSLHTGGSPGET